MTSSAPAGSRLSWLAPEAVACPTCQVAGGEPCQSTGGGNCALVPTHQARRARVAGWSQEQQVAAGLAVWQARPRNGQPGVRPAGVFEALESAAAQVPERKARPMTPRGVRLSEAQAEEIERLAAADGQGSVSTVHFHGDAQHRQTVQALERKGIATVGEVSPDGYERAVEMTEFGWQVYQQHRLIIRRNCP